MSTSKQISRVQQLDSPDTPLRRRSALNASSTPFLNESHQNESVSFNFCLPLIETYLKF